MRQESLTSSVDAPIPPPHYTSSTYPMASVPLPVQNLVLGDDPLSLDRIRAILTRLEDTIIFSLIERAQFAHNPKAYRRGEFRELQDIGFNGSWLDWFLKETESFHCEQGPARSVRGVVD